MPNIIRIRDLKEEFNLNDIIIPVDKGSYTDNAKRVSGEDLKTWILSGATSGSGGSGTSGTDGTSGSSGISPCLNTNSNVITIYIVENCDLAITDVSCVYNCDLNIIDVVCN